MFVCLFLLTTTFVVTATDSTIDDLRFNPTYNGGFNRKSCYIRTLGYLHDGTLARNSELFFRDGSGRVLSDDEDITLTLSGCRMLCGHHDWYLDIGPRLTTWLLPILLLISNVDLSPLDKRRFFAIIHLIGDPIDSIWSLVHKIDAWNQCYTIAKQYATTPGRRRKVIATVFAGFEEIKGPDMMSGYLHIVVDEAGLNHDAKYRHWELAAVELADSRSDEFLRTTLAVILYFYNVIASFVEAVGGSQSSPPGGRIGAAMFISWLVPVVLLSNSIGGFTSRRSASNILIRFAEHAGLLLDFPLRESIGRGRPTLKTEYFQSLGWSGAIYTFRTWKTGYLSGKAGWWKTPGIFCISTAPICIGMTASFVIIWYTLPVGLGCRHFWVVGVFTLYFVIVFLTWISYSKRFATGLYHWHLVLWKDALIGVTSLLMIFLSSSGLFNSCTCSSGYFYHGARAHVPLNADPFYQRKDKTIYPAVVAISLVLQLVVFGLIAWIWWNGLQLMRWSEKARAESWKNARGAIRSTHEHAVSKLSHQDLLGGTTKQGDRVWAVTV